MYVVDKEVYL